MTANYSEAENTIKSIAIGGEHACALTTNGHVGCWGRNVNGQLGNGTDGNMEPGIGTVIGINNDTIHALTGGYAHNCILLDQGKIKCWGGNTSGQIGNGLNEGVNEKSPVHVIYSNGNHLTGATKIALGYWHTCAIVYKDNFNKVMCWGLNNYGQLGNGNTTNQSNPVEASLANGAIDISAGGFHTCAILPPVSINEPKMVKCWGMDAVSNNTQSYTVNFGSTQPDDILELSSGHTHNCAVIQENIGSIAKKYTRCWGIGSSGRLGDNTTANKKDPLYVLDDTGAKFEGLSGVSAGGGHTCAVTSNGEPKCWGLNSRHELGNGTSRDKKVPTSLFGNLSDISEIQSGWAFSCMLSKTGNIKCFGYNRFGQLGDGTYSSQISDILPTSTVIDVSTGLQHGCAVMSDGSVNCWGNNGNGEIGDGTFISKTSPTKVTELSGISEIGVGNFYTCALKEISDNPGITIVDDEVWCWGKNNDGRLGNGMITSDSSAIPTKVEALVGNISSIAVGYYHTCVIIGEDRNVKCWGRNNEGQLGNGENITPTDKKPVSVVDESGSLLNEVSAISAGELHTCALTTAGKVVCWGKNTVGQLGAGNVNTIYSKAGLYVKDQSGTDLTASSISAGRFISCAAVGNNKDLFCWGEKNTMFNSLVATSNPTIIPFPINGPDGTTQLSGVVSLTAGDWHACAQTASSAYCYGSNNYGELITAKLGITEGTTTKVLDNSQGYRIRAGGNVTCIIDDGKRLKCFGNNHAGQLGNGYDLAKIRDVITSFSISGKIRLYRVQKEN